MNQPSSLPLSTAERKHRLPHGAQRDIAGEEGVSTQYVSLVVADELRPKTEAARKKWRRVQVAIARKLRMRVDDVFPSEHSRDSQPESIAIPA